MAIPSPAASLSAAARPRLNTFDTERLAVPPSARKALMMRKYEVASLRADGRVHHSEQIAPATPLFESAFSAFARGTLIETTNGPVAIEDLEPGMKVMASGKAPQPVLWIGSMTLVPDIETPYPCETRLTRIMSDSFGMARPMADVMAGPAARILANRGAAGPDGAPHPTLVPARSYVDGVNVIDITPPRPVKVYHLCLHRHATINVGGLEIETFHPGPHFERQMGPNMLTLFLTLFPHIGKPSEFGNLTYPRLPLIPAEGLELA